MMLRLLCWFRNEYEVLWCDWCKIMTVHKWNGEDWVCTRNHR